MIMVWLYPTHIIHVLDRQSGCVQLKLLIKSIGFPGFYLSGLKVHNQLNTTHRFLLLLNRKPAHCMESISHLLNDF